MPPSKTAQAQLVEAQVQGSPTLSIPIPVTVIPLTVPTSLLDKPVPPLPTTTTTTTASTGTHTMTVGNLAPSPKSSARSISSTSTNTSSTITSRRPSTDQQHQPHSHHHHFFPSRSHKLSSSPSASSSSPMLMFRSIMTVVKDKFSSSSSSSASGHAHSHHGHFHSPGSDSGLSSTPPPPGSMSSISASSMVSQSETSISTLGSTRSVPLSQVSGRRPSDAHSSSFSFAALSSPPSSPAMLVRAIPTQPGSPRPTGVPLASLDGIPDLVRESFAYIERHGADVEGIYRTACPGADLLAEWAAQFDSKTGRRMVPRDLDATYAPDAVAQAVKNYFKALPEEVIAPQHVLGIWNVIQAEKQRAAAHASVDSGTEEDAASTVSSASSSSSQQLQLRATMIAVRTYVRCNLIRPHRLMLAAVLRHLQVMAQHADKTRVTAKTLSMLWPSVLCCPHACAASMEVIQEAMFLKAQAPGPFEWMIEHAKDLTAGW